MGDRANVAIIVHADQPPIVLYTHWSGYELPTAVAAAIARARGRWTDPQYCGRILVHKILSELGADPDSETGFGLSTGWRLGDNSYPILIVDIPRQGVGCVVESRFAQGSIVAPTIPFAAATAAALESLRNNAA